MDNSSSNKFLTLIDQIPNIAVQGYNKDRNVIYWNKASEVLYGYSKEEALGKKLEDLIIPDFMKDEVIMFIQNWYEKNEAIPSSELTLKHKDGHTVYVYSSHVMLEKDGNNAEMFCIDIDLTAQKKQEEQLKSFFELEINLQVIANTDSTILQVNNASKSILGYEKEELINKSFLDFIHPDDIESTIEATKDLSIGKTIYYFENRYKHKDGHYIDLAWSATTANTNHLIYATAQNITEFKKAQKEREEQEKIILQQARTSAIGEMIGNIAHQWRQPLSVISTISTGLKMSIELNNEFDKQSTIENLGVINQHTQHLSHTIDDFRNFFTSDLKSVGIYNLKDTIRKVRELTIDSFNSNYITYIENTHDISFEYNENILIQSLINLYNNSKDALSEKTYDRYFFIETRKNTDNLELIIKDNGGGIDDSIINKIFDPYFTTKHRSIGTGIGLYMTNQIITKQLKGSILAKSVSFQYNDNDYVGAQFIITLPIN